MTAPLIRTIEEAVPAVTTAGTDDTVLAQAPYAGVVTAVQYVPEALVTGAATNNRTLSLVNKGQDGSAAVTVATLTFGNGVNAAANNEVALTLSAPANLAVADGDTLLWRSVPNGTGLADPGGLARVVVSRS